MNHFLYVKQHNKTGQSPPMLNKHHTEETKRKISEKKRGTKYAPRFRSK
jgi:hypothetical protein